MVTLTLTRPGEQTWTPTLWSPSRPQWPVQKRTACWTWSGAAIGNGRSRRSTARVRLDRWRLWNLVLLLLGALAGGLAAQTWLARGVATGSAIAAAMALSLAGILRANALNADQTARWTHARAASEALKLRPIAT